MYTVSKLQNYKPEESWLELESLKLGDRMFP